MTLAIAGCSALAAAAAVWRLAGTWALLPFLGLVVVGAALSWIDLTQHRLPNLLVLPSIAASVPLLLVAAALDGDVSRWLTALAGGAVLFVLYLALALVSPRGMGMGDVKLAALVGLFSGYLGWATLLTAAFRGLPRGRDRGARRDRGGPGEPGDGYPVRPVDARGAVGGHRIRLRRPAGRRELRAVPAAKR